MTHTNLVLKSSNIIFAIASVSALLGCVLDHGSGAASKGDLAEELRYVEEGAIYSDCIEKMKLSGFDLEEHIEGEQKTAVLTRTQRVSLTIKVWHCVKIRATNNSIESVDFDVNHIGL
ncbi:hypothetical protein [Stratiformator vulcanicus]|uniref:Uncharacterized protein n=1 Tax=Stratiformator vulcanicus TaxID=2527980 RepID=A0A517R572_9PLAN|nr:hypothetical protein [Stratiformator vulcanicus]QDT39038.1 hypothetical protein Pan189_34390 [Stratiformator vulcanicus]